MHPQVVFGISVLLAFVVWGMIAARYIWPALRDRPRTEALRPLLFLHAFRFVGPCVSRSWSGLAGVAVWLRAPRTQPRGTWRRPCSRS
jgi:hypothetical protein